MGSTSSTQEMALEDGDGTIAGSGCRPLLCCGKGAKRPRGSDDGMMQGWREESQVDAKPQCDCFGFWKGSATSDQEALLQKQKEEAVRRKIIGGGGCLALLAGVCATVLGLRQAGVLPKGKVWKVTSKAYIAKTRQFAEDVARGECNYEFPGGEGPAMCFCQLAGNAQCADEACSCSQGCKGKVDASMRTVTFKNIGLAGICEETTALLTIPKPYFEHVGFLLQWCPNIARSLFIELLENGFKNYQKEVKEGPVKQCVHSAKLVSVPWLHVHTFCPDGLMDGLQETDTNGWCGIIDDLSAVPNMVDELVAWALDGEVLADTRDFASCRSMGCEQEVPKPLCSCTKECQKGLNVTCCQDWPLSCGG